MAVPGLGLLSRRKERPDDYEEPYFWSTGSGYYNGKYPAWWDISDAEIPKLLEENYEEIKAEILDFYERRKSSIRPNWLPWGYSNEGWLTVDLYSFGMRTPKHCRQLPFINSLVKSIPGMMLTQVAVLQPHTRVRPHIGETSALVRCHLPIVVPGTAPDLGMRVGHETRCWEEGSVFALNIAYRHSAWNLTDKPRLLLIVDYVHPDFADRQHEIESNALALMVMKGLSARVNVLKRAPVSVTRPVQAVLARAFRVMLFLQRHSELSPALIDKLRPRSNRDNPEDRPKPEKDFQPEGSPSSAVG